MADTEVIEAVAREGVGKGASRALRRQGRVPAVIYGDKKPPETISVEQRELERMMQTGTYLSTLLILDVDGKKTEVIPRDVQTDPVKDFPVHVDFLRLGKGATVTVEVPVNFLNEEDCPGLKRGGVLNVVRYTIEVVCPAASIPESFDADLSGLDLGDSMHISAFDLPEGVMPTITDRDFTVLTIAAPAGLSSEDEGEEGEEGEEAEGAEDGEESEGDDAEE